MVLVGIPWGRGGSINSKTDKFVGNLRRFINNNGLNIGNKNNISKVNFDFLGFENETDEHLKTKIVNEKVLDASDIFFHQYESLENCYLKIEMLLNEIITNKCIPFSIGGDHSITYPILKAVNKNYNKFGVIHIDAHSDCYDNRFDFILEARNLVSHYNFVTKALNFSNLKKYNVMGIRGINNSLQHNESSKMSLLWCKELKQAIKNKSIKLDENIPYYLTIDIDILSSSEFSYTSTPSLEGLTIVELKELLSELLKYNIIGIDIVETVPSDTLEAEHIIAELILFIINLIKF